MTEEANGRENWSRLLKWLAIVAVVAFLIYIYFFHGAPYPVNE